MSTFTVKPPVAVSRWNVSFNGHEPRGRVVVDLQTKPVYIGTDGKETTDYVSGLKRARKPVYDATGRPLYWTDDTQVEQSVNPYTENEDGTVTKRTPVTETFEREVRTETPVVGADGNQKLSFAEMNGSIQVIDADGNLHPKQKVFSWDILTDEERDALQAVFTAALARFCAAESVPYTSVTEAKAAGAL